MSDPTANKALVAEFIDALFTEGELEAVDRYLAPGFVNHDPFPGFAPDREGMRQTALGFRQAFPDWHAGQQAHIAEGDLGPHRRPGVLAAARDRASDAVLAAQARTVVCRRSPRAGSPAGATTRHRARGIGRRLLTATRGPREDDGARYGLEVDLAGTQRLIEQHGLQFPFVQ